MWNSKPKKGTHKCRKRKFGQPKLSWGACYSPTDYRAAVDERIEGKRLERAWKREKDPDDSDL